MRLTKQEWKLIFVYVDIMDAKHKRSKDPPTPNTTFLKNNEKVNIKSQLTLKLSWINVLVHNKTARDSQSDTFSFTIFFVIEIRNERNKF